MAQTTMGLKASSTTCVPEEYEQKCILVMPESRRVGKWRVASTNMCYFCTSVHIPCRGEQKAMTQQVSKDVTSFEELSLTLPVSFLL